MSHRFTIGVEEEFQIIDPTTGELRSHVSQLVAATSANLGEQVKREMHQSIVEIGTKICENVDELREDMHRTRGELVRSAESVGLYVAASGTHPFSNWIDQVISPGERYKNIVEELQQLARSLLIFGMHVHVAVPDRTTMIDLMNMARYFLPHLLALFDQLAFLDGSQYGPKIISHHSLPSLPTHGNSRPFQFMERIRRLCGPAHKTALHRRREKDMVGCAAAPNLRHARVSNLRRHSQNRRCNRNRGAVAGHHS